MGAREDRFVYGEGDGVGIEVAGGGAESEGRGTVTRPLGGIRSRGSREVLVRHRPEYHRADFNFFWEGGSPDSLIPAGGVR